MQSKRPSIGNNIIYSATSVRPRESLTANFRTRRKTLKIRTDVAVSVRDRVAA